MRYLVILISLIVFLSTLTVVQAARLIVPDDYDTIMDAMEEAEFGDTVLVKEGVYFERIQITDGVNLVSHPGDGGNDLVDGPGHRKVFRRTMRTIIDGSELEEPDYLVSFPYDTPAKMVIDGFTIRNLPKFVSGVNLFLLEVRGCSPGVLNNIIYGNKSWGGMLTTGLGVGMGPALETTARPLVVNNIIYGNDGPGLANGANSAALINNNEVFHNRFMGAANDDSDAAGIGMRSFARPVIENNDVYSNGAGVGALNLEDYTEVLVIRGNKIYDNRRAGIGLRIIDGTDTNIQVLIENNRISGNLKAGIMLAKVDSVTVRYNTVYDNRKAGIIGTNLDELKINNNEVHSNLTAGVRLLDIPVVTMRGNHVYRNGTAGVDFIGWER